MYPAVKSVDVQFVLDSVDRADFLPPQFKSLANEDSAVPIADGITVPPRSMTALVVELLDLKHDDRVLEIGTGSGYQTAVLASMCAEVVSIDVVTISAFVGDSLDKYKNVTLYSDRDGRFGPLNEGQFEAILVTAGSDKIHDFWKQQLCEGGRLVVPIGENQNFEVRKFVKHHGEMSDCGTFAYINVVPLRRG